MHLVYESKSTDFKNADLTNANLSTAHIFNAKFTGAILIDSKFTGSVLSDVDFAGSDLSGADFSSTSLRNIDFSSAKNWTKISSVKGAVILVTVPPSRDMYNWAIENGAVYVDTIEKWLDTLTDPQSRAAFEKQLPLQ